MKLFRITGFTGHWPVGTAAIVFAQTKDDAIVLLENHLSEAGLSQRIDPDRLIETSVDRECAFILCDGNY